jgi:hypothetical protein
MGCAARADDALRSHEAGDGVFSPREVRDVRQAAVWPSHPPHAGMNGLPSTDLGGNAIKVGR